MSRIINFRRLMRRFVTGGSLLLGASLARILTLASCFPPYQTVDEEQLSAEGQIRLRSLEVEA